VRRIAHERALDDPEDHGRDVVADELEVDRLALHEPGAEVVGQQGGVRAAGEHRVHQLPQAEHVRLHGVEALRRPRAQGRVVDPRRLARRCDAEPRDERDAGSVELDARGVERAVRHRLGAAVQRVQPERHVRDDREQQRRYILLSSGNQD